MTFSRPLRMSWLIVGIVPFKTTPPTGTAGGGRKNKVLSPKRGAHHTEEALAVKRRCRTVSRLAVWPPSGILDTGARQKPHDAARLRRSRHQRHHRHRHLPPPREGLPQRGGPLLGGLAALNYRGIRPGALASDFFSGAKLIPILLFVGLGLFFVDWHRLALPPPAGESTVEALKLGGFAALFACTGFEYVPVAAGETENPRRNVPLALFFALFGSVVLYALVQIVFIGTHPDPGAADKPLAEAAAAFAGPWAGGFVAVGSVISSFGYLTAVALVTPRYLSALSENGELPPLFARTHPRFGTPSVAIGLSALVCAGLAVFADFDRLADLNNAAVFAQYVPTCLAVPMLRRTKGASAFHLPLGPTIPVLATLGCILFLNGIKRADAVFSVATLAVGLVLHAVWRVFGRRPVLGTG